MNESENTSPALQPLGNLMKLPKGKKKIPIDPALLTKLDLATLEHTLIFRLNENPHVRVEVISQAVWLVCRLTVATYITDWPKDGEYAELFGFAFASAANRICTRRPEANFEGPYIEAKGPRTILRYQWQPPLPAGDLAQILQAELQNVLRELPAVYSLLAHGPRPGTSSVDDEENEEEAEEDNPDEDAE